MKQCGQERTFGQARYKHGQFNILTTNHFQNSTYIKSNQHHQFRDNLVSPRCGLIDDELEKKVSFQ